MGLGDVARAQGSFADAERAYLEATKLLPSDPTVAAALSAARAKAPLSVPPAGAAEAAPLSIDLSPLAAVPPPTACSTVEAGQTPELCAAVEQLIKARSKQDLEAAAASVIAAQSSLQSACQALDPRCGPHVSVALADAGRGFRAAGKTGKSVQIAKLLMQRREYFPASEEVAATAALEAADQLLQLGLFDQAADSYGAFATTNGSSAEAPAALERRRAACGRARAGGVVVASLAASRPIRGAARLVRVGVVAFGATGACRGARRGASAIAEREPRPPGACETCRLRDPSPAGEPGWSPKARARTLSEASRRRPLRKSSRNAQCAMRDAGGAALSRGVPRCYGGRLALDASRAEVAWKWRDDAHDPLVGSDGSSLGARHERLRGRHRDGRERRGGRGRNPLHRRTALHGRRR